MDWWKRVKKCQEERKVRKQWWKEQERQKSVLRKNKENSQENRKTWIVMQKKREGKRGKLKLWKEERKWGTKWNESKEERELAVNRDNKLGLYVIRLESPGQRRKQIMLIMTGSFDSAQHKKTSLYSPCVSSASYLMLITSVVYLNISIKQT